MYTNIILIAYTIKYALVYNAYWYIILIVNFETYLNTFIDYNVYLIY